MDDAGKPLVEHPLDAFARSLREFAESFVKQLAPLLRFFTVAPLPAPRKKPLIHNGRKPRK